MGFLWVAHGLAKTGFSLELIVYGFLRVTNMGFYGYFMGFYGLRMGFYGFLRVCLRQKHEKAV